MGTVDDVADAVEFFTSKLARWISGQQLLVSGDRGSLRSSQDARRMGAGLASQGWSPA